MKKADMMEALDAAGVEYADDIKLRELKDLVRAMELMTDDEPSSPAKARGGRVMVMCTVNNVWTSERKLVHLERAEISAADRALLGDKVVEV